MKKVRKFWDARIRPVLKSEHEFNFKLWVWLVIGLGLFLLGGWIF